MVDINYIIHGIFFILIKWVKKITISDVVMVIALVMMSIGLGVKMKEVDKNKEITIEKRQESIPLIINIDTASMTELETLPRIGPVTAKKIIDFRQTYGTFKKPEDIIKVSGIGEKTYEKIKGQIGI